MSAIEQIKEDEGFSGRVYRCTAGATTIGYGRNLDQNPLTPEEAEHLLKNDLKIVLKQAVRLPYYHRLPPVRRGVILNMIYNIGISRFNKFVKMNDALCNNNYELAADEMLDSKWATQVGERAQRLAKQMRLGE